MSGVLQSIWRYPVKGFTPEPLEKVSLTQGQHFPFDRLYAVEDGPSGFDPAAPQHLSKQKFTVLAKIGRIAQIRTSFDDASGVFTAKAPGVAPFRAALTTKEGRAGLAAWLTEVLKGDIQGPLKVLPAPGSHRFMDDVQGFVSIINLASVRALEASLGRPVDPRRFRANLYVEGWPAWVENKLAGGRIVIGEAQLKVAKPIVRCVASHVDPESGERDVEVVRGLFDGFGHILCGVYASVVCGGLLLLGDAVDFQLATGGALGG
jgi:uncharacterized protein YcbX